MHRVKVVLIVIATATIVSVSLASCSRSNDTTNSVAPKKLSARKHRNAAPPLTKRDTQRLATSSTGAPAGCGLPRAGSTIADANLGFALQTFAPIDRTARANGTNTTYSPYSASTALQMLANGADSGTDRKLLSALCLKDISIGELNAQAKDLNAALQESTNGAEVTIANSIWTAPGNTPAPRMVTAVGDAFRGELRTFELNNAAPVNAWIEDQTKDRIHDLLNDSDLGPDMIMLLINAITFDGTWSTPFPKASPQPFTAPDGTTSRVPMMHDTRPLDYYTRGKSDGFDAVRIPYGKSGRFAMVLVVPREQDGLDRVIDRLTPAAWRTLNTGFAEREVSLMMPTVKLAERHNITSQLFAAGVPGGTYNELITQPENPMIIGFVKQGTFLEVDEKGTKAAAATVIGIETVSASAYAPPSVVADHPYLMLIEDTKTNTIMFMSAVRNPEL